MYHLIFLYPSLVKELFSTELEKLNLIKTYQLTD